MKSGRALFISALSVGLMTVVLYGAHAPTRAQAATAGLVAAYSFNENAGTSAGDSSGNGNTASLFGSPTWGPGHAGSALTFNGTTAYATVPSLPSLPNWSVSLWVRSPAAPSNAANSGPVQRQANFQINWNNPQASFRGAAAVKVGTNSYAARFGSLAANTWYFLAATYDGQTLKAYTNGVLITSNTAPSGQANSDSNPLTFGKNAAAAQFFQGTVDDIRIYNRALSLAEIQTDMNTPVAGASPDTTAPTVSITTPTSGPTFTTTATPLTVAGSASDNVGVTQVSWTNSAGGSGTASGTTSWTASGIPLQSGSNVITVTALDAANNTGTAALTVTYTPSDTTPPTPPSNLTATAAGSSQINLAWTASTDNVGVTDYQVERCQGAGCTTFALVASPTGTTYPDTGLAPATSYSYRVRAHDAANNFSAYSNAATATTAASLPGGLVAAYSFNENSGTSAADSSGNGYTASLFGGPTWTPGEFGSALTFNGTTAYAAVSPFPSLPTWTISAWVKSPAVPSNSAPSGPIHREANFQINWNHPSPSFQGAAALNVGGSWYAASFGPLAANTWYFLAATYDGETLNAYTNGVLINANPTPSGAASSDPNPLTFGKHAVDPQFFQGTVDQVRIYNRALSSTEIQADMNTPIGGTP